MATEKLIQLFHKHNNQTDEGNSGTDRKKLVEIPNVEGIGLDDKYGNKGKDDYGQIFDILEPNKLGKVDNETLYHLLGMLGSEFDTNQLKAKMKEKCILEDGLTRDRFIELICNTIN